MAKLTRWLLAAIAGGILLGLVTVRGGGDQRTSVTSTVAPVAVQEPPPSEPPADIGSLVTGSDAETAMPAATMKPAQVRARQTCAPAASPKTTATPSRPPSPTVAFRLGLPLSASTEAPSSPNPSPTATPSATPVRTHAGSSPAPTPC